VRASDLRRPRRRTRIVQALTIAVFLGLTARAAVLSVDQRGARRGDRQLLSAVTLAPARGRIFDRSGTALAVTVATPSLYAVPEAIDDLDQVTRELGRLLGVPVSSLRARLGGRGGFVFLKRWITPELARRVKALDLTGVGLVDEPRRAYPLGPAAGPLIGFSNIDAAGVRGIERLEDAWLTGSRLRVAVERDARGRLLIGPGLDPQSTVGGDVRLTLDSALQAQAEQALAVAMEHTGARAGFVVSLDPATGDLLALAEAPGFDPNRFRSLPYRETRSRVFADAFEPGSTLKAFLVAAALDAGSITPREQFELAAGVRVPGKWIRDDHPRPRLDVPGILRISSNAGAVRIAHRLGAESHYRALRRFGFGAPTGSGFPEESAGLLRPWDQWRPVDHATIAFGQGISATPIQLAAATAALANGGRWRTPRLVLARRRPDDAWHPTPVAASREVVTAGVAALVTEMLAGATGAEGTGKHAALRGARVAGKTGTAQKLDPVTGSYSNDRFVAWFAGFAPAEDPAVAIVVGLDEPLIGHHTGGTGAAPLFALVAAAHLTHLGIPSHPARPRAGWTPVPASATRIAIATERDPPQVSAAPPLAAAAHPRQAPWLREGDRVFLPDLSGLSRAEVEQFSSETAIPVRLEGRGRAIEQEPAPGTILSAGGQSVWVRFQDQEQS